MTATAPTVEKLRPGRWLALQAIGGTPEPLPDGSTLVPLSGLGATALTRRRALRRVRRLAALTEWSTTP